MKTEAVIFTGKNKVEFGKVKVPDPGPNDVVVATKHSWISNGTEGSFLRQERFDGVTPWQFGLPLPYPMVAGYQKVGIVESMGKDVKGFKKGQWVFATITKIEKTHLGFGGHVAVGPSDANEVYALPKGVDPIEYSGLVLTQVGTNTGSRPPVEKGCHALVMGDGMVGNWAAQTLQSRGAKVAFVGRHNFRLDLLKKKKGDLILNSKEQSDWLEQAIDWTGGEFDIVVDTIGNDVNLDTNLKLIPLLKYGGHYVTAGHEGSKSWMDLRQFIYREATIHCPCGWTRARMESTLKQIHDGTIYTKPLITDQMKAKDAAKAWDKIFNEKDSTLGVVLNWD
ncbi:MAG: zinc-binding dehydrogenase [Candidatus Omnitrophica bacterium]|nr:zinc-binding dehydrogenase [Candidatus Omnitrophota bacterium]